MRLTCWPFLALVSLVCTTMLAGGATRPRYGGTVRAEMQASVARLDPSPWPGGATESEAKSRLSELIFDCLLQPSANGDLKPALAASWRSSSDRKRWEFRLRPGVKFHDGTELTASAAALSIGSANPAWEVSAAGDTVVIAAGSSAPNLAWEIAHPRYSVYRPSSGSGAVVGTGPFRVTEWVAGRRVVLAANEQYWAGRPFLESVEIEMGRSPRDQLIDLELGRTDLIEIGPGEIRRARELGTRLITSSPVELVALVFRPGRPAADDARVRETVALSLDRTAMHTVLLQKQGEIANSLLPQWLSGHAFLFPLARARRQPATGITLSLAVEDPDPLTRTLADRVAVDARQAGVTIRVLPANANAQTLARAELRLVRIPLASFHPAQALAAVTAALRLNDKVSIPAGPEATLAAERAMVEDYRVVPLFHLPSIFAANPRVRNWMAPLVTATGGLRLQDAWIEGR